MKLYLVDNLDTTQWALVTEGSAKEWIDREFPEECAESRLDRMMDDLLEHGHPIICTGKFRFLEVTFENKESQP